MSSVASRAKTWDAITQIQSDLLAFMQENIILVKFTADAAPGVQQMTLRLNENKQGSKLGKKVPVYYLVKAGSDERSFSSYWCPYMKNQARSVMIGNESNTMFTAEMDGCSLGVGSVTPTGHRRVTHINQASYWGQLANNGAMSEADAKMAQYDSQNMLLQEQLGQSVNIIGPRKYRRDVDGAFVLKSTTFGVLTGIGWDFYVQTFYSPDLIKYYLRDVKKVS